MHRLDYCEQHHHSKENCALIPKQGNLQHAKQGIGNDRGDTFIWALDEYFENGVEILLNFATYEHKKILKNYLETLRKTGKHQSVYNYCKLFFNITDAEFINELIESGSKTIDSESRARRYIDLALEFWKKRRREIHMCMECYVDENRITPLLNPLDCLANHTQYICGTCGRCICIEHDPKRGLQRWNFPFKSLEIAKLYLRTADYSIKKRCGIYEIRSENGRLSYKIFADSEDLQLYLKKNKGKTCETMKPIFIVEEYKEYANTQIRKLTSDEIQKYMSER